MIPNEVVNPFHTHKADDTVTLPAGDVPDLHANALTKCDAALSQARRSGTGTGLLVSGEAGAGKSHLIAQLRRRVAADPNSVLVAVRLGKAYAGRLWRHLRERVVEELLWAYPEPTHGGNGMLRILSNRFPDWAAAARGPSGSLMDWLLGRSAAVLTPHLDQFGITTPFDYNLLQVLPQIGEPSRTRLALDWLRGKLLNEADLSRLGLPPVFPSEQEQEVQAQDVVLSLLRLAGDRTTLMLCFDEVEAIQAGTWDAAALRQFATVVTTLLAEPGPRAVLTFVRPRLLTEMRKVIEHSNMQKIAQDNTTIFPLDHEEATRIVVARLEAEPTCRHRPDGPFWPIGEAFVAAVLAKHPRALTPRVLISACSEEFERLKKGLPRGKSVSAKPTARRPVTPEQFAKGWSDLRGKNLDRLSAVPFDTVFGIGLPWLVHLTGLPADRVAEVPGSLRDVDLLFQPRFPGEKPVGVSFCNHEPRPLPWRLDRVRKRWAASRGEELQSLVVLRSEAERTTENAKARLQALREDGVRVVMVDRQQLAELAAFQVLMTKSLEGKVLNQGHPVEPAEYDAWAKANLSDSVKELLHLIFEPDPAKAESGQTAAIARK